MKQRFTYALSIFLLSSCSPASDVSVMKADATSSVGAASIGLYTSDWARGFATRTVFYDTGTEVIAFDAQFTEELARDAIKEIRRKTSHPIRYLVITHPNPDKFNGANEFRKIGAKVIASEATAAAIPGVHAYKKNFWVSIAKQFTDTSYPAFAQIDETFRGTRTITSNGHDVVLSELAHSAVSSTQTVAFLRDENALVVGDVVHVRAHAWLEGPVPDGITDPADLPGPDLDAWSAALDEIASAYGDAGVYGGRGGEGLSGNESLLGKVKVADAVSDEKKYLLQMQAIVTGAIEAVGADTANHDRQRLYATIEARAKEAYPSYALPDMLQYGVYGLVNRILHKSAH